ncbi:MAG: hypothetical protein HQK91_04575 [Nitrospirae bacterium]|nr:hypothetical protein [Nitrospirota bacterium]
MFKKLIFSLIIIISTATMAFAFNPLIIDEGETLGAGTFLFRANNDYSFTNSKEMLEPQFALGIIDNLDLLIGFKSDMTLTVGTDFEAKIMLYKNEFFAFSLKPVYEITALAPIFAGGKGSYIFDLFAVGSFDLGAFKIHENVGYDFTNQAVYLSSSGVYKASEVVNLVLTFGTEKFAGGDFFGIGGFMFELGKKVDIELGVKYQYVGKEVSGLAGLGLKI